MGFSSQNRERGFTLIELLISMGIGLLVMATVTNAFISQKRTYQAQEQVNEMQQNARAAMDLMIREIKMAGYDPTGIPVVGVTPTSATEINIVADLNANGVTNAGGDNEDITYTYDAANDLIQRKEVGINAVTLAENIAALDIQYLESDGVTVATNPADIRMIQLIITAQTSAADPDFGFRTYTLTSLITPPNLAF